MGGAALTQSMPGISKLTARSIKPPLPNSAFLTLIFSSWFGLATGLCEGLGLWLMQFFHIATWKMQLVAIPLQLLWATPICYVIIFGSVGLLLAGLQCLLRRLPWTEASIFLFSAALFVALLAMSGRLRPVGLLGLSVGLASVVLRYYQKHERGMADFCRRSLPWLAAATVLAFVGIEAGTRIGEKRALAALPPAQPGSPNILLLVVDTLRADKLSSYGYSRQTTPHMDEFGREGVTFESAVATSSWTLPTHASMFTGVAPHVHGAETSEWRHPNTTLADAMLARGYRTEGTAANQVWVTRARGFGRGFVRFDDGFFSVLDMFSHTLYGRSLVRAKRSLLLQGDDLFQTGEMPKRSAASVFRSALDWIGEPQGRPFFVFLNVMEVHEPYDPPAPWNTRFSNLKNPRIDPEPDGRPVTLTPAELEGARDTYDEAIAYVDDQIGRLLAELKHRGLEENTIVILTADHGELLGEHGLLDHRNALYWELVHVPLLMRWPGHLPAGKRVATTVSMASLPATILDLVGDGKQNVFPGPSLGPLLTEAKSPSEWPVALSELAMFHNSFPSNIPSYYGAMKSLVSPQWHFILHQKFGPQLFDRVQDPQELHDQAKSDAGRMLVQEFMKTLQELGATFASSAPAKDKE